MAFNQSVINIANQGVASFTFAGAETGTTYQFSIDDANPGTAPVTGSGSITTAGQTVSGINLTSLDDGNLLLAVMLRDGAGNVSYPYTKAITRDALAPTIQSISVLPGTYNTADTLSFTVSVSEAVSVSGTPLLTFDVGGKNRTGSYNAGASTPATLVFSHTPQLGDVDTDGISLTSIVLNGGAIKDAAGNDGTLTFTSPNTTGVLIGVYKRDCSELYALGTNVNGVYTIDPDGTGGLSPFAADCDMTSSDGDSAGGWTLVMNYLSPGDYANNPGVYSRSTSLPLQNSTTLGDNEEGVSSNA